MQTEELNDLIKSIQSYQCESQNIEVKSAKNGTPTRLFDTLSSFSNQDGGGIIIFGLEEKDDFNICGVYDPEYLQHRLAEQCKQMEPNVRPLFTVTQIDNKIVISAEIPGVDVIDRPVYYKGVGKVKGSYIRVGEADELMSDYEIYSYNSYHKRIRDDIRIAELADVSVLDDVLLDRYLLNIKESKPNTAKLSNDEILNLMGIIKEDKPTVAGILCFAKYPQAIFPGFCITAVSVPGIELGEIGDESERFIDNKRIEGTISEMLDDTVNFIKKNMSQKIIINEDGRRIDKFEYPIKAIREAILNALMHRDLSIHTEGTPIRLVMYKNRIEIENSGGLYGRITIDNLGKVYSDTRNQTLAHILELQGVAESRYSGIPTMKREMYLNNLPDPIFTNDRGIFKAIFKNEKAVVYKKDSIETLEVQLLEFCKIPKTREEIAAFINKTQYYTVHTIINPLIEQGLLNMILPNTPKSKNQKFYS